MYSAYDDELKLFAGFPHSEISGSKVACHLSEAYRRLLRPSSSFNVAASTICTYVTTKLQENYYIVLYIII